MAMSFAAELFTCDVPTPIGALQLIASRDELVGVRFPKHCPELAVHRAPVTKVASCEHAVLARAERELLEHFGKRRARFTVPLAPHGTEFQKRVWRALQDIPFGETRSYGQLAAAIGRPTASRAVGAANARNPLAIFIPCHRVIGSQGGLTGFAGGHEAKQLLLDLELGTAPDTVAETAPRVRRAAAWEARTS
jgi:methylated-DNA-[protein]-cysteine S-methyltransferase